MAVSTSPRSIHKPTPSSTPVRALLAAPMADYYLIVGTALLLFAIGLAMVLSASSVVGRVWNDDSYYFFKRQALFGVVGIALAVWISRMRLVTLQILGWIGLVLALILLAAIFTPMGQNIGGNRNWLNLGIGGLQVQPSEFAKLAIIVWGAAVLGSKQKLLDQPRQLLIPFLPVSLVLVGLVVLGQDLGTASVMLGIVVGMLWAVGASWRILASFALAGVIAVVALILASPRRMGLILRFVEPDRIESHSNQAMQGLYALAAGGWWGKGLGASRQKLGFLAQSHTDYVFAIVGEELGLVGALVVLALIASLCLVGFRVAMRSEPGFTRWVAAGVTVWFAGQSVINLGVVLGLLPVVGVPLPLLSYGGSSLLANLVAIGFLLACARHEPDAQRVLSRGTHRTGRPLSIVDGGRS